MENEALQSDVYYRAVDSRDARWDGRIYLGVRSTGIYCRPSCPARTPLPQNCEFFKTSSAAVAAGYRACKRCRPDALPGSRESDSGSDTLSRALRAIRAGYVDEHGISGLASKLGVSERHLHRLFVNKIGASPSQLNQTRRAQTARMLIEQSEMSMTDIAFSAGFGSIRQFNDTMVSEYGTTPTQLRLARSGSKTAAGERNASSDAVRLSLRLKFREPYDIRGIFSFFERHCVGGRDEILTFENSSAPESLKRAIDTPHGLGYAIIPNEVNGTTIQVELQVPTLQDITPTLSKLRNWLDLDSDPRTINDTLLNEELLRSLIRLNPGIRIPGSLNHHETAINTVLGQQVSLAAARTFQSRFVATFGEGNNDGLLSFPGVNELQSVPAAEFRAALGLTESRAQTLSGLITALANDINLDSSEDHAKLRTQLLKLKGIGPWTVEYIALRCLGDPDAFPSSDLVLKRALNTTSVPVIEEMAKAWRPWRGYALMHLWNHELTQRKSKSK